MVGEIKSTKVVSGSETKSIVFVLMSLILKLKEKNVKRCFFYTTVKCLSECMNML